MHAKLDNIKLNITIYNFVGTKYHDCLQLRFYSSADFTTLILLSVRVFKLILFLPIDGEKT